MRELPAPPGPEPSDDELIEAVQVLLRRLLRSGRSAAPPASHVPDAWLPPAEAAAYAAVSEDTLRAWIARGQLPAGRVGKVIRIRRSDIDTLLAGKEDGQVNTNSPGPTVSAPREPPSVTSQAIIQTLVRPQKPRRPS